ncbi:MAG: gfo/Idh/MocA family oxidoreductase [Balneolaceae bacterium]|nr:MAG: gfo/Idh/MocA family oxidoreductase [Balneolaceae bacterium]
MKKYNIGIIGYGGFGKFLHNAWSRLDNVHITAISDPMTDKLQGLGSIKTFTDWRDLIRDPDITLVAIVTEPASHELIATACMEAGKHVLIEKPLAITLSDAEKIIQVRDQTNTVAAIDFIMRFNPLMQTIRHFSQQGLFGRLRRVDVENYAQDEQLPPEHWFWNPDRSGGILIEHAVHFIDLVHYLAPANVLAVNGLKHSRNPQQEDQIMANVLYEGGLIATHYHSFARPGFFETTTIKLAYDLADIELQGWIPLLADVKAIVNSQNKQTLLSNPFFEYAGSVPIGQANDESRPAGWGGTGNLSQSGRQFIYSGGIRYEVDEVVTGVLQLSRPKQDVYTSCVQASLLDVLKKINDPSHPLAAGLETGITSLVVAVRATESARSIV